MFRSRIILAAAAVVAFCSCQRDRYLVFSGYAQGGEYRVKVNVRQATAKPKEIERAICDILTTIDTTFSGYNKNSQLSRLNAGAEFEPSAMFNELLSISEHYRELTGGAFDAGAGPLFDIWGFGFKNDSLPSPQAVDAALAECRQRKVLNFNAIAQGYTCDVIAGYLKSIGVEDMLVDVGEIYCSGKNPSGEGWSIGIDTPVDGNDTPGAQLSGIWTSDRGGHGVVTSGNYRKFYIRDGRKYAHTIDPRTGYPVSHNLLSATVVAPTATEADALATFFMVIGFDEARRYIQEKADVEACLITTDSVWKSPGF